MSKFQLKWGILACGGIAETFARDLWPSPECRGRNDIEHKVVAAATSSSVERAQKFLKEVRAVDSAKAYGSYEELTKDPNVDIIYIATPHSHHYQNAMLCLEAGKNVLCEKAFTTNAAQCEALIKKAKEKNVFLMEAVGYAQPTCRQGIANTRHCRYGHATSHCRSTCETSSPRARSARSAGLSLICP